MFAYGLASRVMLNACILNLQSYYRLNIEQRYSISLVNKPVDQYGDVHYRQRLNITWLISLFNTKKPHLLSVVIFYGRKMPALFRALM